MSELRAVLEPRHAEDGDLRPVADWTARHPGRIARIAGLLHLAEHDREKPIGEKTMRSALQIGGYLLEHALATLTTPDERLRKSLRWLSRWDEVVVTQRDIHRGPLNSKGPAEDAAELAALLVEVDALRPVYIEPSRGRPSPTYAINPHLRRQDGHSNRRTISK